MLRVRVTNAELDALDAVAARFALGRGELVRLWISAAAETFALDAEQPPLDDLLREVTPLEDLLAGFDS